MEASPPPFRLDSKAGLYVDGWPLTSKIFSESGLSSLLTPSLSTEIYFASSLPPSFSLSPASTQTLLTYTTCTFSPPYCSIFPLFFSRRVALSLVRCLPRLVFCLSGARFSVRLSSVSAAPAKQHLTQKGNPPSAFSLGPN